MLFPKQEEYRTAKIVKSLSAVRYIALLKSSTLEITSLYVYIIWVMWVLKKQTSKQNQPKTQTKPQTSRADFLNYILSHNWIDSVRSNLQKKNSGGFKYADSLSLYGKPVKNCLSITKIN